MLNTRFVQINRAVSNADCAAHGDSRAFPVSVRPGFTFLCVVPVIFAAAAIREPVALGVTIGCPQLLPGRLLWASV